MARKKRGLGKGLTDIFAEQKAAEAARSGRSDGLDILIPGANNSRTDGLDKLNPRSRHLNDGVDPDFGVGYEVVDPAPSRSLGRSRAQKLGYNQKEEYLVIVMRDGTKVGYSGVEKERWEALEDFISTNDYIEDMLSNWSDNGWDTVIGAPPQSTSQSFEQGSSD